MVPNFVSETIVQNVGESNAAFMARVNLFIATQRSYYEQAGGSYPPASPASTAYLGYPPSEANFTVFWDVTNTQHRQIASFFYDYTYYLYLMALPSPIFPPSFAYPVIYQGMWDANTNTPTLVSGTGTQGHYYQVSVSGTTTLDGISSWGVDDWVVFNGTTWTRVANAQATEILKGVAEIATQPETDAGIDDTRIVTPLKLGGWWTAVKAAAQTISGVWTFITSLRIRSTANPNYAEITGNFTANRTVTIQDASGTVAYLSDIPPGGISGSGTANEIAYFTGPTAITSLSTTIYPSLIEIAHVKGVTSPIQSQLNNKVNKAGDTMLGNLEINVIGGAELNLNAPNATDPKSVLFQTNSLNRFRIRVDGANDNLVVRRYDNAGAFVDAPFEIIRSTGNVRLNNQTASRILSLDANQDVTALDTATYPSLTELSYVKGVTSDIQTQLNSKIGLGDTYFTIPFNSANQNPADNATYYFGAPFTLAPGTGATARRIFIPVDCTLIGYAAHVVWTGGTTEQAALYFRINDTTDVTISTTIPGGSNFNAYSSALNTNLSAGDLVNCKMVCPIWATNPTAMTISVLGLFKRR